MKKVDVVMAGNLDSIVGPSQTLKRIIRNHGFFFENGYDITVFASDSFGTGVIPEPRQYNAPNAAQSKIKEFFRYLALNSFIYSALRILLFFYSPYKMVKKYHRTNRCPDIVVFHSIEECYFFIRYFRKNEKIALFTHSDGKIYDMLIDYFPRLRNSFVHRKLLSIAQYVMERVDVKPCIARVEEINLLDRYPCLKGKTTLVINGIDDLTDEEKMILENSRQYNPRQKYNLVSTGTINGRKGQWIIVEALNKINRNLLKDIHIHFIGDGPERLSLIEKVNKYGLNDNVTFYGAIPNKQVFKYLYPDQIYILMSQLEGLPISIIEALRSGLPVISTNISGIPELVSNENGVLLPPNVEELAKVFEKMGEYDWSSMGVKSRELFESYYSFDRMKNDYLHMLNKIYG